MRFSLFNDPWTWDENDDERLIDVTAAQSIRADRDGFAAIFSPEHHFSGHTVVGADPLMMAAYLAPQLEQAYLGFAVQTIPLHHPVRLVERYNLLDQLTKGRALFGVGSGVEAMENLGFGIKPDDKASGEMANEILEIAQKLWAKKAADPPIEFETKYYKGLVMERIVPASYRKPHPILMGVAFRDSSIERAARNGWPVHVFQGDGHEHGHRDFVARLWRYRKALAAAGHPQSILDECMTWTSATRTMVAIADTEREAKEQMEFVLDRHQRFFDRLFVSIERANELGAVEQRMVRKYETRKDPQYVRNWFIYGTAEMVAEQFQTYADLGLGNFLISFSWGVSDPDCFDVYDEWYRRFVKDVMPGFEGTAPPSDPLELDLDKVLETLGA